MIEHFIAPGDHAPPEDLIAHLPHLDPGEGWTISAWSSQSNAPEPYFYVLLSKDGLTDFLGVTWEKLRALLDGGAVDRSNFFFTALAITKLGIEVALKRGKVTTDLLIDAAERQGIDIRRQR